MPTGDRARLTTSAFPRHLARWQQLVTATWLDNLIAGVAVIAAPAGDWRLFEVGCGMADFSVPGHIPGAGFIDTNWLEQGRYWNKVPDAALLPLLLGLGIRHDTTVVLYGKNNLAAARAAHLLLYAGVADVRLLDGGFTVWQRAGLPLAQGDPVVYPAASDFGVVFPAHPEYLIDTMQAATLLQQIDGALVSIRSWQEFIGLSSGYCYIDACGDIPGARWGRAGEPGDVNSMRDFQHPNGAMKPPADICAFWEKTGIHAGQQIAFYCGTSWRASLAFFYAWLMNWERISVYDGGWYQWSSDPANPVLNRARAR